MAVPGGRGLFLVAAVFLALAVPVRALAGAAPQVHSVMEGRAPGEDRPTLVLVGKSLTKFKTYALEDPLEIRTVAPPVLLLRSKGVVALGLEADLEPGEYDLVCGYGRGETATFRVSIGNGRPAPGMLGTAPDQAAAGDHLHDARYPTRVELSSPGVLNAGGNPVHWTELKGVPAGFADGTDDAAWTEDGGNAYRSSGRVGVGTPSPGASLHVAGGDGAILGGTHGAGEKAPSGAGTRFVWNPLRSALRAGTVDGTQWDDASIGDYSSATGRNTRASGTYATAMGFGTTASGIYGLATGVLTTASGTGSTALGFGATASGTNSTSWGEFTTASGQWATASGFLSTASGAASTAMGYDTTAQAYASLVLGRWNVVAGTTGSWVATDPVLVVGNGTSAGARSNALTLLKDGNLIIAGTLTQASDARGKADVAPLGPVAERVAALRGVTYRRKAEGPDGPLHIGLVAQEVRAVFPELVAEDAEGNLSVAYANLSAVLVEAVKEQGAALEAQRAALEAKEREIADLRRSLAEEKERTEERLARLEAVLAPAPESAPVR